MKKRLKRSASFDIEEPLKVVHWEDENHRELSELLPPELPGVHSSMYSSEEEVFYSISLIYKFF